MHIVIEIIRGVRAGQRLEFVNQPTITIGRDPQCDVVLDAHGDILASTRHAEVREMGAALQFVDLGSSNGTFVNGQRVQETWIQSGMDVELGQGGPLLRFTVTESAADTISSPPPVDMGMMETMMAGQAAPVALPSQGQPAAPSQPPQTTPVATAQPAPTPGAFPAQPMAGQPTPAQPVPAPVAQPTAGGEDHKVGQRTVARMVESAIQTERTKQPRSTQFFRTLVDKEVRKKNMGLFVATIVLAVVLVGAVIVGIVIITSQKKDIAKKDKAHQDALAKSKKQTKDQMDKIRAEAEKQRKEAEQREAELKAAMDRLKKENEKIKAMAEDKGPQISQKNKTALYLLASGHLGMPRYATCTAFAIEKRVLATNSHCVVVVRQHSARGAHFYVIQNENPSFRAKVVSMKPHPRYRRSGLTLSPDIGLLKVDKDLPNLVNLASDTELREVKRGSLMFSFGFPGRLADVRKPVATLVHGRIGRLTRFDASLGTFDQNQLLQHSALSMGGASGSPLFNADGKVIGLHAGSYASRSATTVFDPQTRAPKKILMAKRLGYKFGIRIDTLKALRGPLGWETVQARGRFALVTSIPANLLKVNCRAFGRKMARCSKGKLLSTTLIKRCETLKKAPSPSSVAMLRFARCASTVRGCDRKSLSACLTKLKTK